MIGAIVAASAGDADAALRARAAAQSILERGGVDP
jgi:hypothetical protein